MSTTKNVGLNKFFFNNIIIKEEKKNRRRLLFLINCHKFEKEY